MLNLDEAVTKAMNAIRSGSSSLTRRHFFSRASTGIGVAALASLLAEDAQARPRGLPGLPHFPPKAKRVIYLFQHGAPSQLDLFDYKPKLAEHARRRNCPIPSAWASASPA